MSDLFNETKERICQSFTLKRNQLLAFTVSEAAQQTKSWCTTRGSLRDTRVHPPSLRDLGDVNESSSRLAGPWTLQWTTHWRLHAPGSRKSNLWHFAAAGFALPTGGYGYQTSRRRLMELGYIPVSEYCIFTQTCTQTCTYSELQIYDTVTHFVQLWDRRNHIVLHCFDLRILLVSADSSLLDSTYSKTHNSTLTPLTWDLSWTRAFWLKNTRYQTETKYKTSHTYTKITCFFIKS